MMAAIRTGSWVMLWQVKQLKTLTSAIGAAREGRPTVLTIVGDAGMGKTSLLRELQVRASGFNVLFGHGEESRYREPFAMLKQLGVDKVLTARRPLDPQVAAQSLREIVDELSLSGPVLIIVDDLQWVDRETVEALYWLYQRAHGDRLLIAVGSRPKGTVVDDTWQRIIERAPDATLITLNGLTLKQTATLVRGLAANPDETAIRQLWEHTNGNPFHLQALLRQYEFDELVAMRSMPAPAELAEGMRRQLRLLSREARLLLYSSAVLGFGWSDLPVLTAVAEVETAADAVQELLQENLLVARSSDVSAPVRIPHALTRAAIYQTIPFARRRELHLRAAEAVGDRMAALEHRVAASDRFSAVLADELQEAAAAAHSNDDFQQAGYLYLWSSTLTESTDLRNRRWLESVFDTVLARDTALVRQQITVVQSAPDLARRALILGLFATVEKRWLDALVAYASVSPEMLERADSRTRYRSLVLTAWSMTGVGRDRDEIDPLLVRAVHEVDPDPALAGYMLFANGMQSLRRSEFDFVSGTINEVPKIPASTPPAQTYKLAWRGSLYAMWGKATLAEADLLEVTLRIRAGLTDIGDGVYFGLLAFARWQNGSWDLANVDMSIALDSAIGQAHPMIRAIEPMLASVRGDFEKADRKLAECELILHTMPWREAMHLFTISLIARLHAGGDEREQQGALNRLTNTLGEKILSVPGFTGALWTTHMAIAAIWASEFELAERYLLAAASEPSHPEWTVWIIAWLRALIAERQGDLVAARTLLTSAVDAFTFDLPLYRAHVLADRARLTIDDDATATRSANDADALYRLLGAAPYLSRVASNPLTAKGLKVEAPDVLFSLSDRERDVATLLAGGLSYEQIGRELYITRATVGYHVTRIYAKTGVTSRHELTDLLRRNSRAPKAGELV
jgi:DNA-binding CsgD family transcriptional regulator